MILPGCFKKVPKKTLNGILKNSDASMQFDESSGIHENIYETQLQDKHDVNLGPFAFSTEYSWGHFFRRVSMGQGFQETTKPITEVIGRM